MRRQGITYQDVSEAAESLIQVGESPSINKVRELLGGTGSHTTLSKHLAQWRNEKAKARTSFVSPRLLAPFLQKEHDLPESLETSVKSIWSQLEAEASAKFELEKEGLEGRALDAEARAAELEGERDQLRQALEEKQEQYNLLLAEKEALVIDYQRQEEANRLLTERNQSQEERYQDYRELTSKQMEEKAEAHQAELARIKQLSDEKLEGYQKLIDKLSAQLEDDRQANMAKVVKLEDAINKHQKTIEAQKEVNSELKVKLAQCKGEMDTLCKERAETLALYRQQDEYWKALSHEITKSREVIHQLSATNNNLDFYLETINASVTKTIGQKLDDLENMIHKDKKAKASSHHE